MFVAAKVIGQPNVRLSNAPKFFPTSSVLQAEIGLSSS